MCTANVPGRRMRLIEGEENSARNTKDTKASVAVSSQLHLVTLHYLNSHTSEFHPQTLNVRITFYSIINSITGKHCSIAFI